MGQKQRGHWASRQPTLCGAASGQYSDPGQLSTNAPQPGLHTVDRWRGGCCRPGASCAVVPGNARPTIYAWSAKPKSRSCPTPAGAVACRGKGARRGRAGREKGGRREGGKGRRGCARCRALDLPYSRCVAPWAYEFPVTQLVQALKYEGALANARVFGTRMVVQALREQGDPWRRRGTGRAHAFAPVASRRAGLQPVARNRAGRVAPAGPAARRQGFAPDSRHGAAGRALAPATRGQPERGLCRRPQPRGGPARRADRRRRDHGQHGCGGRQALLAAGASGIVVWALARATQR